MHRRLSPRANEFNYRAFFLCVPLSSVEDGSLSEHIAVDRPGLAGFRTADHGDRKGGGLGRWARETLARHGLGGDVAEIRLVCMPRILGYVFNPVSFWLCEDGDGGLRAVLCEVNNTFGETHCYVCAHADGRPIRRGDPLEARKEFHVSPFLERSGTYRFRFSRRDGRLAIRIDHHDGQGRPVLQTSIAGTLSPLTKGALRRALLRHPLLTLRVTWLIHWQALRLLARGMRHIPKPPQLERRHTLCEDDRPSGKVAGADEIPTRAPEASKTPAP